jgi:hypothetical protein
MYKRLILGALALTTIGLATACEPTSDAASKPSHHSGDNDVAMLDLVWPQYRAEVCSAVNDVPQTIRQSDEFMATMLASFEEGADSYHLSSAGRAHLVALIEAC